jgi:hypothetical protein
VLSVLPTWTAGASIYPAPRYLYRAPSTGAFAAEALPVAQATGPSPVCPTNAPVCCEWDSESGTCIGGCCDNRAHCCPDGKPGAGNKCTNVLSDWENCGRCGNACPTGQTCSGGACTASCPPGLTLCGHACVDTTRDPVNCGACGTNCADQPGGPYQGCCPGPVGRGQCMNLSNNDNNCGACGNVCPLHMICEGVQCVCETPWFDCGGVCKDLSSDPQNCGTCFNSCNGGTCVGGQCNCPSASGLTNCGGNTCVNLQTDANNCAWCGHECGAGVSCIAGQCECPQGQSWTIDYNECIGGPGTNNPVTRGIDATLHGPPGSSATVDMCYCTLGPAGTVAATKTPDKCYQQHTLGIPGSVTGSWNLFDPACCAQRGVALCGDVCCPYGQSCCNNQCTNLSSDDSNCGACGNVCGTGNPHIVQPTCQHGACVCPAPYPTCGKQCCGAHDTCCGGLCYGSGPGMSCCNNQMVNVRTDVNNCGTCGHACASNQHCSNGVCQTCAPTPCQACDLNSGTCSSSCSPGVVCDLINASSANHDYAVLSAALKSQGFTAGSTQALVLLQGGAAIGYSYSTTFSGSEGEAVLSYVDPTSGAVVSNVMVSRNSIPEYVLYVDGNGKVAQVPASSTPPSSSSVLTKHGFSPTASAHCTELCSWVCDAALFPLSGVALPILAAECGPGAPLCLAYLGYLYVKGVPVACEATCQDFCACHSYGIPCGEGCCPLNGFECSTSGQCTQICTAPCTSNYGSSQCSSTCATGDPCFQCLADPSTPNGSCELVGFVRCGQPGQPNYKCCPVPEQCCDGTNCTDTDTDNNNCGACGQACASDQTCESGKCICMNGGEACAGGVGGCCVPGETCCNGACVDLQTNQQNCGSCGKGCTGGQCVNGQCVCPSGQGDCGGVCTDLTTTAHCGSCGNSCKVVGSICSNGQCVCPSGQGDCGGVCTDLTTTAHCGSCTNICTGGKQCVSGQCVCTGTTPDECGGICTNKNTDQTNCGGCGNLCHYINDDGSADWGSCVSGHCHCPPHYTDCGQSGYPWAEYCCPPTRPNCGAPIDAGHIYCY